MLVIHGDNIVQSRLKLTDTIKQKTTPELRVVRLEGPTLTRAQLESHLAAKSLFGEAKLVVLENLLTLPRSKKKEELIALISAAQADPELTQQLITWDGKTVTAPTLKKFSGAQILEFKTSPVVFKWLDSLNGRQLQISQQIKLLRQAVQSDGAELCLALLARQIKLLIQTLENQPLAAPPFVIKKLRQQAASFNLSQLLAIHQQLIQIDREIKSSQLRLSLDKKLDLLILKM